MLAPGGPDAISALKSAGFALAIGQQPGYDPRPRAKVRSRRPIAAQN